MQDATYIETKRRNIEWLRRDLEDYKDILANLESLEQTEGVEQAKERIRTDIHRTNECIMKELNGGLYEGLSGQKS